MAEKNFLSWVGFKGEEETPQPSAAPQSLERIRELEAQLKDLKARRDITALTKEEFEILATETAMSLIKTAQQRESRALAAAQKILNEANESVREKMSAAESKAKSILSGAESRGRKYLEAAEYEANEIKEKVQREAESILQESKREASALTNAGRREAEKLIAEATGEISNFRSWLSNAISEAERLHRIQTQSLHSAEQAIIETRSKLAHAFERISGLQNTLDPNITNANTPSNKNASSTKSPKSGKKKATKKRK